MKWEEIPEIDLYSDGGAEPNPGKGGFGVIMSYKGTKKEFSQGFRLTTNNRMELMGVIHGLERLKTKSIVNVYSDSRYVVDGITKGWAVKWRSNNWYRNKTEKAINFDLWERLLTLISNQQEVKFNWIRGHFGHPENEKCDELANMALNSEHLIDDTGYEENLFNDTGYEINPLISSPTEKSGFQDRKANIKIKSEGDYCRKCGSPVVFKPTKKKDLKPGQTYYFEYYFLCPKCKTVYMVEEAKRFVQDNNLFK
jgi:ribonuclease HI